MNALVHRDYSIAGGAISVAVFDDRLEVWSAGRLPAGLTPEMLKGQHDSVRRNPLIANAFHRRGLIEQWGRGTNKIVGEAAKAGCPEPEFEEVTGSFVVRFRPAGIARDGSAQVTAQVTAQAASVIRAAITPVSRGELQKAAGLKHREHFRKQYLEPLLSAGLLEMTIPDKPRSSRQKYRATEAGRAAVEGAEAGEDG